MSYIQKEKWDIEKHLNKKSTSYLKKTINDFEEQLQKVEDGPLSEKVKAFYSENLQILKMKFAERIGRK